MMRIEGFLQLATDKLTLGFAKSSQVMFSSLATLLSLAYLCYMLVACAQFSRDAESRADLNSAFETATPEAIAIQPARDLRQLAEWHLFGEVANEEGLDENAPLVETKLQLALSGVFVLTRQSENAYAIIHAEGGQQKKYRPGDELPGGATLQAIEKTRVILLHKNRQEYLGLKKHSQGNLDNIENLPE